MAAKRESRTLFALFVLAIVLLVWRACAPRVTPTSSVEAEASGAAAVASAVEPSGKRSLDTSAAVTTKAAAAPPTPAASTPNSLVPPLRAQRLDDYADSRDLQQFIDNLRAAADGGDGEAAGLIARAYDECYFAIIGAKTGRKMHVDPGTLA